MANKIDMPTADVPRIAEQMAQAGAYTRPLLSST